MKTEKINLENFLHFYPFCKVIVDEKYEGQLTSISTKWHSIGRGGVVTEDVQVQILDAKPITVSTFRIKPILNQIGDMTDEQVFILANIAFGNTKAITWTISRKDKSGFWLDGIDQKLGIKYYFRINDYFEIFSSTIFPETEKEKAKKFDHNLGGIVAWWADGVPYAVLTKQLTDWEFDVFHLVRHKLAYAKGASVKVSMV
jgi:hypothetical protein